jgi:branched-chain amino acid aminotransferase
LGFGTTFTDHVFRMDHDAERGWHAARIEPYGPLSLDPAAAVLHYGQTVFEGLKALRGVDGQVRLFRPDRHAARFHRSCERLRIPPLPEGAFVESVRSLVGLEHEWVPRDLESSLYVRPFIIATEPFLGIRPATRYAFTIVLSPVGSYYAQGFRPVRIWVERTATRAAPGGLGAAKTAANYAASLSAAVEAKSRGYDQVLWTDAREHAYLEEVGTMNLFVVIRDEVFTAPLDGTILPGITRHTVIEMLREQGATVHEARVSLDEVRAAQRRGDLREIFGTGTAAVVSPVGTLGFEDGDMLVADGEPGALSTRIREQLVGVQRGRAADPKRWMVPVEPWPE